MFKKIISILFFILFFSITTFSKPNNIGIIVFSNSIYNTTMNDNFIKKIINNGKINVLYEYYMNVDNKNSFYFNKKFSSEEILRDINRKQKKILILVGFDSYYFLGIQNIFQKKQRNYDVIVLYVFKHLSDDNFFFKNFTFYFCDLNKNQKLYNFLYFLHRKIYVLYNDISFSSGIKEQIKQMNLKNIEYVKINTKKELLDFIRQQNKLNKQIIVINSLISIKKYNNINYYLFNQEISKILYEKFTKYVILINFFKLNLKYSDFIIQCIILNKNKTFIKIIPNYELLNSKNILFVQENLWKYLE